MDTDRLVLLGESGGGFMALATPDDMLFAGGGEARLLAGWGVSDHLTIAAGLAGGGMGLWKEGRELQDFDTRITLAAPLVFRFYDLTRVADLEVAAVALSPTDKVDPSPGVRVAVAGGLSTVRVGSFLPMGLLQLSYSYYPEGINNDPTHIVLLGTRVVVNMDP